MKKSIIGVVICFCTPQFVISQGMFNNGGFEDYSSCPTVFDQTNKIIGCIGKNDSPDYYNCNYNSAAANNGTGSVYLGAIRDNTNGQDITEGITLELTKPLDAGKEYEISISSNYGVSVYGDPDFNYNQIRNCYNLKFLFCMGNESGDPLSPHHEIDVESVVGNANTTYSDFMFNYIPDQDYTHLYILTGATSTNTSNSPNPDCMSSGAVAYVYYNIIDDLAIVQVQNDAGVEMVEYNKLKVFPNPTDGTLQILNLQEQSIARLISVTGQLVQSFSITPGGYLNLSNIEKGVYYLCIEGSTSSIRKRIVLQ